MPDKPFTIRSRRIVGPAGVIEDGAVIISGGRIADIGEWSLLKAASCPDVRDLGDATLLPGLVNAHAHLELSHMSLPPLRGEGFLSWVRWLVAQPMGESDTASVSAALAGMIESGTAAVADIATRQPALVASVLDAASLQYCLQFERFGYFPQAPLPEVPVDRLALAGHALYSTDPETLRRAKAWDRERGKVFSLHLAEHEGETELLAQGTGEFADFMRERILPRDFKHPGMSPVAWADALGLLDGKSLAVHAVHVSKTDIDILKSRGSTVCLCPRSNEVIGVGRVPARALLDAGIPCCLGTDSLASSPDLDLFGELRALLTFTPLTLAEATGLLTATAARLYAFEGLGSLAPGSAARFAVLPGDLEEALAEW
ncbi:MAG: amidohydrolase family protein [Thermodesulfobacteriota bacterium]